MLDGAISRAVTKLTFMGLFFGAASCYAATTIVVPTGADVVANGVAFQAALNNAQCGDTIVLQAGATYQGPAWADQAFLLPYKPACTGSEFITIQTSNLAGLSAEGVRVQPEVHAAAMPKLVADVSGFGMPVIVPQLFAHHYKLIGLEITNTGVKYAPNLVNINPGKGSGTGGYPSYDEIIRTHDFVIDRCFIHAAEINAGNLFPTTLARTSGRGVNAEGVNISIINSYIGGLAGRYASTNENIDSMGIFTVAGPGPILIENNYIEAQFNNIFLGGGDNYTHNTATVTDPTMTSATLSNVNNLRVGDLVAFSSKATSPHPWETGQITAINGNTVSFTLSKPASATPLVVPDPNGTARWNGINISNVQIRRNFLNKPDAWNAFSYPKSFIEVKACVDCVIDGNRMYSGVVTNVGFTPRNQGGSAPWQKIENMVYSNNIMIGYGTGLITLGTDNEDSSVPSGNWIVRNNLWLSPQPNSGFMLLGHGLFRARDVSVSHNTILNPGTTVTATGVTNGQVVFKDNIVGNGEYGINCMVNSASLQSCFPTFQMTGNVIVGTPTPYRPYCTNQGSVVYPAGNACVSSAGQIGFVDLVNNDLRLAPTSPFKGKASDGTDPGVDMDALLAAQGGAGPTTVKAVMISSPYDGQNVSGSITASADPSPNVQPTYVEFHLEGQLAGTSNAAPFSTVIDTRRVSNGSRSLVAKAFDGRGYVGSSNPVSLNVSNLDEIAPTVTILSPANGSTLSGSVTLSGSASDNTGVTRVEFLLDSAVVPVPSSTSSPFSVVIDTRSLSNAAHTVVARAYDAAGNVGSSNPISVNVANNVAVADTSAPTTSITSPTSSVTVSGTVSVAATASDNVGVTKVEFFVDDALAGVSTTSPYRYSLDTTRMANGSHRVASRAYDSSGNAGTSAPVSINVNNIPRETTVPTVTVSATTDSKGVVTLSATATDNVGVARVEFYVDGKLNTTDVSAPFSATTRLTGPSGSRHLAMAKAYDAAGNVATSEVITLIKKQ
jgi:hypothetical protein